MGNSCCSLARLLEVGREPPLPKISQVHADPPSSIPPFRMVLPSRRHGVIQTMPGTPLAHCLYGLAETKASTILEHSISYPHRHKHDVQSQTLTPLRYPVHECQRHHPESMLAHVSYNPYSWLTCYFFCLSHADESHT